MKKKNVIGSATVYLFFAQPFYIYIIDVLYCLHTSLFDESLPKTMILNRWVAGTLLWVAKPYIIQSVSRI
jgi:hypothetical protein